MRPLLVRIRHRELGLLLFVVLAAIGLGSVVARDVRRSADDARQVHRRLSDGLDLIENLQFSTQEVRRILLYALHTSNANRQLQYAEQSRAVDAEVHKLLRDARTVITAPEARAALDAVAEKWAKYLVVRDEVIGLILEGSLPEGVQLDERQGAVGFNEVRRAIADLKDRFGADAAIQVENARIRTTGATWRLILMVVGTLGAAAVGVGLVNRRTALEGLLRSEAHKGAILQAVPNAIISTDAAGRIIELNDAAERTFGYARDEALGAPFEGLVLPPERHGIMPMLLTSQPGEAAPGPRLETVGRRRDGSEFPMQLAAVTHAVGQEQVCTLHLSDLTAHRQAEEQLRRARDAAEVATRAKSDFLATMSHELRTPLNTVVGTADLLRQTRLTSSQRELVRLLRSSGTALLGLIGDVLDYSRIEAGMTELVPAAFSLATCIEEALDAVTESAARKGLEIGYLIEPGVPGTIVADQDRVRQVLFNLLSNAVKFTDAGEVSARVAVIDAREGEVRLVVRVKDSGCGIPEDQQDKLFQRFSQIRSSNQHPRGTGLGLAISAHLANLMGGALSVNSAPGSGSTFSFTLSAGVPPGASAEDPSAGSLAGVRVLAVLGPGVVRDQMQGWLRAWGADVYLSSDEADARTDVGAAEGDVIVVDADASGGALRARALRLWSRNPRGIPLVELSRLQVADGGRPRQSPLVVTKPVRRWSLQQAMNAALGRTTPLAETCRPPSAVLPIIPLSVLLVEDDDANRRVARLMLEELGAQVDEASSGPDAVARARDRRYDVILMDVQLPGLDGFEATRRIRADRHGASPVIIALTANVREEDETRCREAGMNSFLPKPLRLATLAATLAPLASKESWAG